MRTVHTVGMILPTKHEVRRDARWQRWRDDYAELRSEIAQDDKSLASLGADWMDSGEADAIRSQRDRRFRRLVRLWAKVPLLMLRDVLYYPLSPLVSFWDRRSQVDRGRW